MNIRKTNSKDKHSINKWLKLRNQELKTQLPCLSFIVPGVAAGSVRLVEGGYGILESLVTNPYVSGITRNKAIDALVSFLLIEAKSCNIKNIMAFSTNESVLNRSLKHGFNPLNHTIISRSL